MKSLIYDCYGAHYNGEHRKPSEVLKEAGYIEFVENGKKDKPLGELCNEAYRAVQLKRKIEGLKPFSLTSEDGLVGIWNEMIYYFHLNTAVILGKPHPEYIRFIL